MEQKNYTIRELLGTALEKGASDLHITVGVPPLVKVRGEFEPIGDKILNPDDTRALVRELFEDEDSFREFLAVGDKDFSLSISKMPSDWFLPGFQIRRIF
jgi:twitching motility protein PilT